MKLLTLNCHSWIETEQEEKIKIIVQTILEKQYDVVALQEVNQSIEKKAVYGKIKEDNFALVIINALNEQGPAEYRMTWDFSHIGYGIYEEGSSIITKHPIVETRSFFASSTMDSNNAKSRNIVGATVNINGELIDFYSCHTGWWRDEEEPFIGQADRLLSSINKDRLAFYMGDFNNNAFIRDEGYDYLINNGLFDIYTLAADKDSGITVQGKIDGWDLNKHDLRIDLILANREVKVKTSKVIFNGENKPVVSDHFGVEAETY